MVSECGYDLAIKAGKMRHAHACSLDLRNDKTVSLA